VWNINYISSDVLCGTPEFTLSFNPTDADQYYEFIPAATATAPN